MATQVRNATEELAYARNQTNGEAMRKLSIKRKSAVRAAEINGITPFSVWNFNPISIAVEKLGTKLSVPRYNDPKLGINKSVPFGDSERKAKSMVFRNLMGYSEPTSATPVQGDPQNPKMEYDWQVVHPVEQVRAFEYDYNEREGGMGGVLVFQGDAHTVGKSNDQVIHVPTVVRAEDGGLIYTTQEVSLAEKLGSIFARQREYCFRKLAQAKDWSADPDKINSVHDGPQGFQAWGQYAIDMGWQDQDDVDWMVRRDASTACTKCGKTRKSGKAYFCEACNHPYDAYAAFMAGMDVDKNVLSTLPEKQLKEVLREMARRKKLFEMFEEQEVPKKAPKSE